MVAASRAIAAQRNTIVARWTAWLGDRLTTSNTLSPKIVERQLEVIVDALTAMVGPFRRETKVVWSRLAEHYGRAAAARGLAAGEVVEEMQYLRELLIRYLAPVIAAMRPRQGMALFLRLNRLVDKGVTLAVAGYTDALVATLFMHDGVPPQTPEYDSVEVERQLESIALELDTIINQVARKNGSKEALHPTQPPPPHPHPRADQRRA